MKNQKLIAFAVPSSISGMGWGNGYVALPKGHPCFGVYYNDIQEVFNISVHCGLTYSDTHQSWHPPQTNGMWVVGFDTAHFMDSLKDWPNRRSVMKEANRLKRQLEKIAKVLSKSKK